MEVVLILKIAFSLSGMELEFCNDFYSKCVFIGLANNLDANEESGIHFSKHLCFPIPVKNYCKDIINEFIIW